MANREWGMAEKGRGSILTAGRKEEARRRGAGGLQKAQKKTPTESSGCVLH